MKKLLILLAVVVLATTMFLPMTVMAKGRPTVEMTNNLSYPVIHVDGFSVINVATPNFAKHYLTGWPLPDSTSWPTPIDDTEMNALITALITAGKFPGLTPDEIANLITTGPWYPQKTTGNIWQADHNTANEDNEPGSAVTVNFIDWGDNIESVNPKMRNPFRLEVSLYQTLTTPMTAYKMAVLENPSSPDEQQGTNATEYMSDFASIISPEPKLIIQFLGASAIPDDLTWSEGNVWTHLDSQGEVTTPPIQPVSFAPELNVAGKYIYGASEGGWKPAFVGYYRITFYIPEGRISLLGSEIGNFVIDPATGNPTVIPATAAETESEETDSGATPVIDATNNLTYVDVYVEPKGSR